EKLKDAERLYLQIINSDFLTNTQKDKVKIRLGQIYLKQNQYKDVFKYTDFTSSDDDLEGLRMFVRGAAYLSLNDFDNAREIYTDSKLVKSKLIDKAVVEKAILVLKNS